MVLLLADPIFFEMRHTLRLHWHKMKRSRSGGEQYIILTVGYQVLNLPFLDLDSDRIYNLSIFRTEIHARAVKCGGSLGRIILINKSLYRRYGIQIWYSDKLPLAPKAKRKMTHIAQKAVSVIIVRTKAPDCFRYTPFASKKTNTENHC